MQTKLFALLLTAIVIGASCEKESSYTESANEKPTEVMQVQVADPAKAVLVDASKDGGVWWYPQAGVFLASAPHQGKALADYIRGFGFRVDELGRGVKVTKELLNNYRYVIRATAFFPYADDEVIAYEAFLNRPTSLLLFSDHLTNSPNDALSIKLGLHFSGSYTGKIGHFEKHPVTTGASSFDFIAGSVINHPTNSNIVPLGYLQSQSNQNNKQVAMGILKHPNSRIFFIGDLNGVELLPQPFTKNLLTWLFQ